MGACRGPTRPRETPAGDQGPEDGRSLEDGKSGGRNRQEGRTWETTAAPVGGKAPKWKSRERCRELNPPDKVRTGSNRQAGRNPEDGSSRAARPGEDRSDRTCCGDAKPQESHRELTQFARRPVRENSKGRPNARRDAAPEERCPGRTKGVPEPTGKQREASRR
jgi:hypothetical protein